jgi:hypothetical protein
MRKLVLVLMFLAALVIPVSAFATATVVVSGPIVSITAIDADWAWSDTFGSTSDGIYIEWIAFKPGAASDAMSISDGLATGPEIFPSVPRDSVNSGQIIYYNGRKMRPVIDYSDCTLTAGHSVTILLAH